MWISVSQPPATPDAPDAGPDAGPDAARMEPPATATTSPRQSTPVPSLEAAGLSTTTIAPRAAAMVAGMPAEAVEAAAARLGKSVYFLLCYFSFNILMRNESHFLIEMSPISHYLGITSH